MDFWRHTYLSTTGCGSRCGPGRRGHTLLLLPALLPVSPVQVASKLQEGGRGGEGEGPDLVLRTLTTRPKLGEFLGFILLTGSLDCSEVGWLWVAGGGGW